MTHAGAVLFWASAFMLLLTIGVRRRKALNARRIGIDPGIFGRNLPAAKREFTLHGHRLVEKAYQESPDTNFIVQTRDMERLVLAPKFLPELRMMAETKLSHSAALVEKHLGFYSGVDIILESHQHSDVCRVQLTQNLPHMLPSMSDELNLAMSKYLNKSTLEEFTAYPTYEFVFAMVLSVSSRVFVDEPLCRDQDWLQVVSAYLAEVVAVANVLRPYPRLLRPLLRPLLAPSGRMKRILSDAHKVLVPAIEARRRPDHHHNDLLNFLVETSSTKDYMPTILKLLVLTSAALHTSTMAAVNALYDMCARPEYIKALKEEAKLALSEDDNVWQFSTIQRLKRLDAFLKESLRFHQPDTLGFNRIVKSPIQLSDGVTTLPPGLFINMPAGPMSRDPKFYENPDTFDPRRFYDPVLHGDGHVSQPPIHEFTGIEPGNLAWGNGRLTCPGRWFASAMNKLIIAALLVDYDVQFPEGQSTRPTSIFNDGTIIPSLTQEILLRKCA